jgi:hypothetical protein
MTAYKSAILSYLKKRKCETELQFNVTSFSRHEKIKNVS